ncbi:hypothetical protein [Natrinema gari]|uniref:Uncharacterized protein n=1 Tax=Natrinema gari JCM 14663 TaxID=1230459 RepID=L9ZIK9_9EURY|nr:hypothetical protein [Natrinema gari]ELY85422.1 hypothetical protein C486_00085 [Natrinema gari JCM 14663]
MSVDHRPTESSGVEQPPRDDPLARLSSDEVLRCRDPKTGWTWFYALEPNPDLEPEPNTELARLLWHPRVDGRPVPVRYHERDGFEPELVSRTDVAEVVGTEYMRVARVGQRHLNLRRGGDDG